MTFFDGFSNRFIDSLENSIDTVNTNVVKIGKNRSNDIEFTKL